MAKNIICPRCEGFIPSNENVGKYPGAISRVDNKTEICSDCGTEEATTALFRIEDWPIAVHDLPVTTGAVMRLTERIEIVNNQGAES